MFPRGAIRYSYALIRHWIRQHSEPGSSLKEHDLQRLTGASRTEVREILAMLTDDGIINRKPKSGTQLETQIADFALHLPVAFEPGQEDQYQPVVLNQVTVPATPALQELFESQTETSFLVEESRLELNRQPLAMRTSFWRGSEQPRRSAAGATNTDMAQLFEDSFGTRLASCDAFVDALSASERLAASLKIQPRQPVLLRKAVLRGADGLIHEVSHSYYASKRTTLRVHTEY